MSGMLEEVVAHADDVTLSVTRMDGQPVEVIYRTAICAIRLDPWRARNLAWSLLHYMENPVASARGG